MNQQKKNMPDVLYHISVVSPDKMKGNKIKSSSNITIEGERVSAIWADTLQAGDNPYSARVKEDGMFCIKDIVLYHKSNIEHSEDSQVNILKLKKPLYQCQ